MCATFARQWGGKEYLALFRGGLVFKAHRLCVSLNSRLESNKEEEVHLALAAVHDDHLLDDVHLESSLFMMQGSGRGLLLCLTASEQRGNTLKGFQNFCRKAKEAGIRS